MPHTRARPLHAIIWGVGLHVTILKYKSQTFSAGSYDFPLLIGAIFSIQSFSPLLPPLATHFLTHLFKNTGAFCSVLWNENVVLNFHNMVERGWAWLGRGRDIHRRQVTLLKRVLFFSCGISYNNIKCGCVVNRRLCRVHRGEYGHAVNDNQALR